MEEVRSVLRAQDLGDCPYGEAPTITIVDEREWLINGEKRNVLSPACRWIISTPEACSDCALNPANRPAPSPRLAFLFYLEGLMAAGAVFHYRDLKPGEWEDLLALKAERRRREIEELKRE